MCRKLILLLIVFAVVAGFSGIASAALIQIPVNRSGGASGDRAPIGVYDGERDPEPTQQGHWQVGNYMFSDRTFTWASVAPELEDAEQVRTYNSDKGASGVTYTVTFPVGATALVAVDDRFGDQQDLCKQRSEPFRRGRNIHGHRLECCYQRRYPTNLESVLGGPEPGDLCVRGGAE